MIALTELLPLSDTLTPADQAELTQIVREAYVDATPIYPIGGGTSLDFGLAPRDAGLGLAMRGLKRVIDYPARDMTITVEAGITIDALAASLAKERQWLPIDLPNAHQATLGGVIATNTYGARRYGNGTMRDYVIGIAAVDGRGSMFHGGGRVVKNVAGYDFCKLLTGSLGTLGVITQVTLKVKPRPECSRFVACRVRNLQAADRLLESMVTTRTMPAAVELLIGPAWQNDAALGQLPAGEIGVVVVGFEGTEPEVAWMVSTLFNQWHRLGGNPVAVPDDQTEGLWTRLAQFPVEGSAALVIKASLRPSRTQNFIAGILQIDPSCDIQSHAGNGNVIARLSQFGSGGISNLLVGALQPAAVEHDGKVIVLSYNQPSELTRQAVWGSTGDAGSIMEEIKRRFDPKNLLNRGRFAYAG
ncbi:MAG: FAD-binding oxidoreductase [Pirellulales bacterium]|nr:FAD-binding oxidoreductase [Pirellulales bacterium]